MDDRRYNDKEVALILRKATQVDPAAARGGDLDGLTLEQLKGIAREVGIDPDAVEVAARQLAVARPRDSGGLLGAPTAPLFETTVRRRVAPEQAGEIVAVIREAMGRQGIVGTEFDGLEWRARDALGGRYVSLRPTPEGTRVRAFGNFRDGAMLTFVGGGIPVGIGVASLSVGIFKALGLTALLGVGSIPLGILGGIGFARFVWKRLQRREARTLERVVSELEASLGAGAGDEEAPAT